LQKGSQQSAAPAILRKKRSHIQPLDPTLQGLITIAAQLLLMHTTHPDNQSTNHQQFVTRLIANAI
jgi:hypothetical protein